MTVPAKIRALGLEQIRCSGVGKMARRARTGRDRRVDHRESGAATHAGVAVAAKFVLRCQQQAGSLGSVWPVTVETLAGRWGMHDGSRGSLGVFVTLDAQSAGLGNEERRVLAGVTRVTGRALSGDRVNALQTERVGYVTVTPRAELALGGDEKRLVIGRVRGMTVEAGPLRRWVVQ